VKPDEVVEIHTPVSRWLRLANFVIDYIAMIVSVGLLFFIIGMIAGEDGITGLESTPDIVFGVIMFLVYYLPLEALGGRTVGKLVTGTKIVTEEGTKPSFRQVFGRTLSRLVPFEPLSFFRKGGRSWHDTWPGIYVVKSR
jgi:uncharacterized RDD family membrane protein YckC